MPAVLSFSALSRSCPAKISKEARTYDVDRPSFFSKGAAECGSGRRQTHLQQRKSVEECMKKAKAGKGAKHRSHLVSVPCRYREINDELSPTTRDVSDHEKFASEIVILCVSAEIFRTSQ